MNEFEGRPYWTESNPHGYSAEDLRRLDREELIEVMKTWFFENYEDPAEKTPHDNSEGGYLYIWGGPYDAAEELHSEFGEYVSEDLIDQVVDQVQSDGLYDWAPKNIGDNETADPDDGSWPSIVITDPPEEHLSEEAARQEVLDRLTALETANARLGDQPPMMGHNQPPEPLEDVPLSGADGRTIKVVIQLVRKEAESGKPDAQRLDREASKLRVIASRLGGWLKRRLNKGADAFAIALGAGLAANLSGLYEALVGAWQAIANWIGILSSGM